MPPDWTTVRALFPAVAERAYLDTASYGPGPAPVLEATRAALEEWSRGLGSWRTWEQHGEGARTRFAALLGTAPANVALVPTVSIAAAQVASLVTDGPRPANVVVGANEFRSNLFPWIALERRGVAVRAVPFRGPRLVAEDLVAAVDGRTALVAVSSVQSATGQRVPLEPLVAACRRHDARLFVDATQEVGALRARLEGVDFLAAAGYKWLLGPRGTGFLYVAPEHVEALAPLAPGWKTPADPYAEYYGPPFAPAGDASRFDQSLAWPCWVGADAALGLLLELGVERIEQRVANLAQLLRRGSAGLGRELPFPPAEHSQIVALEVPDAPRLGRALAERGVVAAVRGGFLRLACHFFNDESDVERAVAAIADATGPRRA